MSDPTPTPWPHNVALLASARHALAATLRPAVAGPIAHAAQGGRLDGELAASTVNRVLDGVLHELGGREVQAVLAYLAGVRMAADLLPLAARIDAAASCGGALVVMRQTMANASNELGVALTAGRNASTKPAHHERLAQLAHLIGELDALRSDAARADDADEGRAA